MNTQPQITCEREIEPQKMEIICNKQTTIEKGIELPISEYQIQPLSQIKEDD